MHHVQCRSTPQDSHGSFFRTFIIRSIRPLSCLLQPRLSSHLPVALCGKRETFEHFGSKEVAEVRRNNDPGTTASITPSAICLSPDTALLYSLGEGVDEDEVEPVVVPKSRESHESIVVHCTNPR
jgi:hypothetical protein